MLDPENPKLHVQIYNFHRFFEKPSDQLSTRMLDVVLAESKPLFTSLQKVSEWNEAYLSRHKSHPLHIQSGLKVRGLSDPGTRSQNEREIVDMLSLQEITLAEATAGLDLLKEWRSDSEVTEEYQKAARAKWIEASAFRGECF